jgi:hypothetical protein
MRTIHRSGLSLFGMASVLVGALVGPLAVEAEDQLLGLAPFAPSWDDGSGYGSVEAIRAGIELGSSDGPVVQMMPPAREIGGLQEELLAARYADAASRGETSGDLEATPAERFAQFRAIELALSSSLGAEQQQTPSCELGG